MKKTIAIILSVLMIVCMMPGMAFAGGSDEGKDGNTAISINGAKVNLAENKTYSYTGAEIVPSIESIEITSESPTKTTSIIKWDELKAKGCTLTYERAQSETNSINTPTKAANIEAGNVKVKIAGDGKYYSGTTEEETFSIGKAAFENFTYDNLSLTVLNGAIAAPTADQIKLKYNGTEVYADDFTIGEMPTYKEGVSGPYELTITSTEKNFQSGSIQIPFEAGKSIANATIKYNGVAIENGNNPANFIYDGGAKVFLESSISVYLNDSSTPLPKNAYKIRYENNYMASVGEAVIIVTGQNEYAGTAKANFSINSYNIGQSNSKVALENLSKVPNDKAPTPKVTFNGKELKEGVDFTYLDPQWSSNRATVTVTVEGKLPNFKGTTSKTYNTGTDISNALVTLDGLYTNTDGSYPKYTYDGNAHRPSVKVKIGDKELSSYSDYTLSYVNDVNASTTSTVSSKRAKVTITGKGIYAGKIERYYTIEPKSISNLRLAMSSSMAYIPIGDSSYPTKYMPGFTLYDTNGRALALGTDYYVSSYSYTNDATKTAVNISLYGKGNYTGYYYGYNVVLNGTSMANCRIELSQTSYKYTGYAHTPTVKVYNGSTLVPSTYYIVSYKNNKDIGTASVTVTGTNGYTGSQTVYFTITGNSINTCTATLSQTTYKYDGLYKEPSVTVKDGYTTLTRNVDYRVTYSNNRVAGTASVIITGIGKYSGSMTKEFKIEGLDQTLTTKYKKYTKYPTSANFNLGASANGDGTGFTYTSSDNSVARVASNGEVEIVGTGIAKITVATKGTTRYNPATKEVTVTVKPNKPVFKLSSPGWGKAKVQITKASGVTKYQIRYGRNGNYKNYYYKYSTSSYKTQSKTFNGLSSGKTYYIKVRAYKTLANGDKVWGNWTTTKKIRVR